MGSGRQGNLAAAHRVPLHVSTFQHAPGRAPAQRPSPVRDVVVTASAIAALVFGTLLLPSPPDDGDAGRVPVSGRD